MEIKTGLTFQMKNVLAFRGKVTQATLNEKRKEMENLIKEFNAKPVHPAVTTTYGIEQTAEGPVMDMEVLIPLDKDVSHEILVKQLSEYRFKPQFLLTNALQVHHEAKDGKLEDSIKELYKYVQVHNLSPITNGYNIAFNDPDDPNDMIVDIMVGIDPNIL